VPSHANSYLAMQVSIDGNEERGSAPGSRCSDDIPGTNPAFTALTTGFYRMGTQAPRDGRMLVGLPITGEKGKALLEHPHQGKAVFPTGPRASCRLQTLGPRSNSHLHPLSEWLHCKSLPAPCLMAHQRQGYLCIPKAFEKQVVVLLAPFKTETVLPPSPVWQSSSHDVGWKAPCNPP